MRILTFASRDYVDLMRLWLDVGGPNLPVRPTILCMDEETLAAAEADGRAEALLAPPEAADSPDRGIFWIRRMALMIDHMVASPDLFVHADLDAFWLKDIASALSDVAFDLAFSMDRGHPADLGAAWGHTLCPGLFMARGGRDLAPFAERWRAGTRRYSDDQNAINRLLADEGVAWRPLDVLGRPGRVCEIRVEGRRLRIVAIPRELCERVLPIGAPPSLAVAHPFFDRRFRTATVRLLSRFAAPESLPAEARPDLSAIERVTLRRNLQLRAAYAAVGDDRLTAGELHHYAALEAAHGDALRACALFDAALAAGADPSDVGTDSHMALHAVGRERDARKALSAAIAAGGTSHVLRRFAGSARRIGAPDLLARALLRMARLSLSDPGRIARRLARAGRRYRPGG